MQYYKAKIVIFYINYKLKFLAKNYNYMQRKNN